MNENNNVTNTDWLDEDDAPELTDAFFQQADEYNNGVLIKRGVKNDDAVRLDADIIAAFKATGDDWQIRLNAVLREWLNAQPSF